MMMLGCNRDKFYSPESQKSLQQPIPKDTLFGKQIMNSVLGIKSIASLGNKIICTVDRKDSIFYIYDAGQDSSIASFGFLGHANSEFLNVPYRIDCLQDGNGIERILICDGRKETKSINLTASIKSGACIIDTMIKCKADKNESYIYPLTDDNVFVYTGVTYDDARDNNFYPPSFFVFKDNKELKKWDLYPTIVQKESCQNIIFLTYDHIVLISPDRKRAIEVMHFIDLFNVFDFAQMSVTGFNTDGSYTFSDIQNKVDETNGPEFIKFFNVDACVTDKNIFILKDGRSTGDVDGNKIAKQSIVVYDWSGNIIKSVNIKESLTNITYNEGTSCLYGLDDKGAVFKYHLPLI